MTRHQFSFKGKASEYFGIWIVNLLLSIITLGIYSAWAKVRRMRYFYANTFMDGHNFEYHANPVSILKGRIIVVVILIIYNVLIVASPIFAILLIPFFFAFPWLINKGIAFQAQVISYRNVRFGFEGSYWRAMGAFIGMPILAFLSLGILAPFASRSVSNYIGKNLRYGKSRFHTNAPLGALYANWGASIGFAIVASIVIGTLLAIFGGLTGIGAMLRDSLSRQIGDPMIVEIFSSSIFWILGFYIAAGMAFLFYKAGVRNVAYNFTALQGGHRLISSLGRIKYIWIIFSNVIVTLVTIGLMRPWAAIRTWRFLAEHTQFEASSDLSDIASDTSADGSVASAEFMDIEGVEFGL